MLDAWQKQNIREALAALKKGIQGERDAAHYLNNHYRDGANHAVIHDLRIEIDGEAAQIDHLLINRMNHFYLLETKNYNANFPSPSRANFLSRTPAKAQLAYLRLLNRARGMKTC